MLYSYFFRSDGRLRTTPYVPSTTISLTVHSAVPRFFSFSNKHAARRTRTHHTAAFRNRKRKTSPVVSRFLGRFLRCGYLVRYNSRGSFTSQLETAAVYIQKFICTHVPRRCADSARASSKRARWRRFSTPALRAAEMADFLLGKFTLACSVLCSRPPCCVQNCVWPQEPSL